MQKRKGIIPEEKIIDWLTEDLKRIEDSDLRIIMDNSEQGAVVQDDRGNVICDTSQKVRSDYIDKSLEYSTTSEKIIEVTQMLTGDFAFQSYCLGKESMSNRWCIYCILSPRKWSIPGYELRHLWTVKENG